VSAEVILTAREQFRISVLLACSETAKDVAADLTRDGKEKDADALKLLAEFVTAQLRDR
jgi:hypothetical protein